MFKSSAVEIERIELREFLKADAKKFIQKSD